MSVKHQLLTFALILANCINLSAKEVSFGPERVFNNEFSDAGSLFFSNIKSADMDLDGDDDIVIAQYGTGDELVWLENEGISLIGAVKHVISTEISNTSEIQLYDLDQDGDMDVVVADATRDQLSWFENSNNGSSWIEQIIDTGIAIDNVRDLAVADIDADGDPDIAIAAAVTTVFWYENSANASSWTQRDTGITAIGNLHSIALGDFDRDGSVDIVYGLASAMPSIEILLNTTGDGLNWTPTVVGTTSPATTADVQVADLDNDGNAEIYSHQINGALTQWTYDPINTTFNALVVTTRGTLGEIQFSDLDQDGDLDILVGHSSALYWYENANADGSVWTSRELTPAVVEIINGVHAADLDQDGDLDLVFAKNQEGAVYSLENLQFHSTGKMDVSTLVDSSFADVAYMVNGLFNGDQYDDIIAADFTSSGINLNYYTGDGSGAFSFSETLYSETSAVDQIVRALAQGDLDRDGDLDVVFSSDGTDSIYAIYNTMNNGPFGASRGGDWSGLVTIANGFGASRALAVVDINQDGNNDIVAINSITDRVSWLDNDGFWTEQIIPTTLINPTSLAVGDIDGNGSIDIMIGSTSTTALWLSNDLGDGTAWTQSSGIGATVPFEIDLADMDQDGDLDLVNTSAFPQPVSWYENRVSGTVWDRHNTPYSSAATPSKITATDFDRDGDIDILLIDSAGELTLIEYSDPSLEEWTPMSLASGLSGPLDFAVFDADKDGDYDLLTPSTSADEFLYMENRGGQYSLSAIGAPLQDSEEQETTNVIEFEAFHNGRPLDGMMELSSLRLGFFGGASTCAPLPMSDALVNPLVQSIRLFKDDGTGQFEQFTDTLIYSQTGPFTLDSGELQLNLPDQHSDLALFPGDSARYFITLRYRAGASMQACHSLQLHMFTDPNSAIDITQAQDRNSGIALNLSFLDNTLSAEQTLVASTNSDPTTGGIANTSSDEDAALLMDVSGQFSDPDSDELYWAAGGLPASLSIDGNTGIISGTPRQIDVNASPISITVVARDPQGASIAATFELTVANVNDAPVVSNPQGDININQNTVFSTSVAANFFDQDNDALLFSATGLPASLSLSPVGILQGIITNQDWLDGPDYMVSIVATDPDKTMVEDTFVMTIVNVNDQPEFTGPIANQTTEFPNAFSLDTRPFFSDIDGDTLTYSQIGLPEGLSISSSGLIAGSVTIAAVSGSPYSVTVSVEDPSASSQSSNAFQFLVSDGSNDLIFADGLE